ncbi:MAG TPA: hypothetical protein VFW09_05680 [Solirubrobacteraceae bacterium]|nr:hypothetical protein [Solirubrobacteraceae bacterium]
MPTDDDELDAGAEPYAPAPDEDVAGAVPADEVVLELLEPHAATTAAIARTPTALTTRAARRRDEMRDMSDLQSVRRRSITGQIVGLFFNCELC